MSASPSDATPRTVDRKPHDEPPQDWDKSIVTRVHYLPKEAQLTGEIDGALKGKQLANEVVDLVTEWGRRSDFLRLYQAIYVGSRLKRDGINYVHAHFAGLAARTALWINKFLGIPFSFTAHANDIFASQEFEISLEKLIAAASTVIAVSDYASNFLKGRFPQSAGKIHRVYNGLDLSKFQRASFSNAIPTIVAIGRLIDKKGFADLVRACELLKKRGHDFRCAIIGEGPLRSELNAQVAKRELKSHVSLLNAQVAKRELKSHVSLSGPKPQKEIVERLASARVLVLPSVVDPDGARDNLPTVIMEAMAAGLPVVSTSVGGIPEMVVPNETGFLVQPGDVTALADAIERLIVDLALAKRFGQAGHERAAKIFSIERNVRELRELLL